MTADLDDVRERLNAKIDKQAATIAALERRLAEARAEGERIGIDRAATDVKDYGAILERRETDPLLRRCVEGCTWAFEHRIRALAAPPPPVAEASGEPSIKVQFTDEQLAYLADLKAKEAYDPSTIIGAPQPTADHTERAREIWRKWWHPDGTSANMIEDIAAALTVAGHAAYEAAYARYAKDHDDLVAVMYRDQAVKVAEARAEGERAGAEKMRAPLSIEETERLRGMLTASLAGGHPHPNDAALLRKLTDLRDTLAARDAAREGP